MSGDFLAKHSKVPQYIKDCLVNRNLSYVTFVFQLDQKFPFSAPQVYCISQLMVPFELNDGRVMLKNIVLELPDFLTLIYENSTSIPVLRGFGTYTVNMIYDLEALSYSTFNHLLFCEKHDRINDLMQEKYALSDIRILCLTPTAILEFDIDRSLKGLYLKVSKVKPFQTLLYVKRKVSVASYVCFAFCKQATKLYQDQEVESVHFLIPNVEDMLEKLLELAALNDAAVNNNTVFSSFTQKNPPAPQPVQQTYSNQSGASIQNNQRTPRPTPQQQGRHQYTAEQDKVLKRISELERLIEDTLDHDLVQELVGLYGKATELFSNNPQADFMVFTMKAQGLLSRPDILAVLDSNRNVPLLDMDHSTSTAPVTQKPTTAPSKQTNNSANAQLLDLGLDIIPTPTPTSQPAKPQASVQVQVAQKPQPAAINHGFRFNSDDEDEEEKKDYREDEKDEAFDRTGGHNKLNPVATSKASQYFTTYQEDKIGSHQPSQLNPDDFFLGFPDHQAAVSKPPITSDLDLLGLELGTSGIPDPASIDMAVSSSSTNKPKSDFELLGSSPKTSETKQTVSSFDPFGNSELLGATRLADKLVKRQPRPPSDQGQSLMLDSTETKSSHVTPTKEKQISDVSATKHQLADSGFNFEPENDMLRLQKLLSSNSSKKSQGSALRVRKDSYSDEENKYQIG